MKRVPISVLKARLSEYLEAVRRGEQVIVTDRGRPVASLSPVAGTHRQSAHIEQLVRAGRIRPPVRALPRNFWKEELPPDPHGRSLEVLLEERAEGR